MYSLSLLTTYFFTYLFIKSQTEQCFSFYQLFYFSIRVYGLLQQFRFISIYVYRSCKPVLRSRHYKRSCLHAVPRGKQVTNKGVITKDLCYIYLCTELNHLTRETLISYGGNNGSFKICYEQKQQVRFKLQYKQC